MKFILSEKNFVIILFFLVVFTFSLAQNESKKIEKIYLETQVSAGITTDAAFAESKHNNPQKEEILTEVNNFGFNN
jgi:hypothetical protein